MRTRAWMLVFSSVEMTNSSSRSACPCQVRPYRSRIRPALASNCGSRGKIQQRCCQGRIASSCSQRQTVLSLIRATNPECSACRATSATLSRDNGRPKVAGSSQASALISTLISGGKSPGATWAGSFLQARQSLLEEALSPQTDHFSPSVQPGRDLIVAHPLGRHENHPGPLYFEIWQRIFRRPTLQFVRLLDRQMDDKWAASRHTRTLLVVRSQNAIRDRTYQPSYVSVIAKWGT